MSRADPRLPGEAGEGAGRLLALLAAEPASISSVTDPERAWSVHVADSLAGLEVPELRNASRIADIGSGGGFPGLVLALALPAAAVDLIESVRRKCDFLRRAVETAGAANARVACDRAERLAAGAGRERYGAVTARAVGRLATLAELASPLLAEGGVLVAWKGRCDPGEEAELRRASAELAMEPEGVLEVRPYPASRHRHLHVVRKAGPTPPGLPRRPGMAAKRPRGRSRAPD
ncbi:MAG: 16S rRNA (guanine(527)-N(7))-methyltransferase RsmG [Solirubrobacterales bacterium]